MRLIIFTGPHLDKDCTLNEEVKQVEEVRYGEFGRTTPFNESNGGKFRIGPPGYYTKTDNRPPYGERRQSLEELLAKHQEESARRSTKIEIEESVWSKRYLEWCNENSPDKKPRARNYTFKEWFTQALDPDKDPLERCLDEYNWVFHKEIEQLADEYEIKIGEKGQVLEEI
ncbi:hypothetical protein Tco_0383121 [Tanacetum coccineum]